MSTLGRPWTLVPRYLLSPAHSCLTRALRNHTMDTELWYDVCRVQG